LFEVAPRDGLQNEATLLSTDEKLALIDGLVRSGFQDIEVTSFVRPSSIPQLADASEVIQRLPARDSVRYWSLVPNMRGLERALEAGVTHVATFLSSSETHNQKNVNRSVRESLDGLREVIDTARSENVEVRAYISTVFGCVYEGEIPLSRTQTIASELLSFGANYLALGDTAGMGHPRLVEACLGALEGQGIGLDRLSLHFHDTLGTALANVYAAFQCGARAFDGSVSGTGGCPYAPGAAGNVASQDMVNLFERLGVDTGIDLAVLSETGQFLEDALGHPLPGRYHAYWQGREARRIRST
jgi:hydroxymethylglutaryl-CoA lyase